MAKQGRDIAITTRAPLVDLKKDFDEMVAIARTQSKLIADALSSAFKTDIAADLRKAVQEAAKLAGSIPAPAAPKAAPGGTPSGTPKTTPKAPTGTGNGGTDPATEERERIAAAERANAAILAAEERANKLREALSQKSTDELIADIDRLQQAKKATTAAIADVEDKAAKQLLQQQKKAIEEELAITSERARKRKEVLEGGAGASVGILGIGRKQAGGDQPAADAPDVKDFEIPADSIAAGFAKTRAELVKFINDLKDAKAGMEEMGDTGTSEFSTLTDSINTAEAELSRLDESAKKKNPFKELLADPTKLAAIGGAIASAGEQLEEFSQKGIAARDAMLNLQAKTGATAEEAAKLGALAEDAFRRGVGESLADAIGAIGTAQQLLGDFIDPAQLGDVTARAAALGQVFDKDVNEVLGKSRTFFANFKTDGKEGADLISLAMQQAGTAMDDVLDTMDEYSQLAVQTGASAEQWTGLLINGVQAGARDTDKIADSLKELQIRLKAGDTTKALEDINTPITAQIQGIVKLGEQGKLSAFEVAQQSAKAIEAAFDAGKISEAVRSQLQVAIAGTPAEDLGSDLYGRIFSADIDTNAIKEQAAAAGAQIDNALGPVTFGEKVQKELDLITTQIGAVVGPVASGFGGILQSVSSVAPALSLLNAENAKFALTLLKSVIPATVLDTGTKVGGAVATKLVTAAQWLWNAALAANPIGLVIAGVVALVAAIALLSDSYEDQLEDEKAATEAQLEGIEAKKKANLAEQNRQKTIGQLANDYEKLATKANRSAAEEKRLAELSVQLNEQYPGLISSTKSFAENLDSVRKVGQGTVDSIKNLQKEFDNLERQQQRAQRNIGFSDVQLAARAFSATVEDADFKFVDERGQEIDPLFFIQKRFEKVNKGLQEFTKSNGANKNVDVEILNFQADLQNIVGKADDVNEARKSLTEYIAAIQNYRKILGAQFDKQPEAPPTEAPPTAPTPPEDKGTLDFAQKTAEAKRKANALQAEIDIKNAKDERDRIRKIAEERRRVIDEQLGIDLKQADDDAKAAEAEGKTVTGLKTFKTQLEDTAKLEREKANEEEQEQIRALTQKLIDEELKGATAQATARKDAAQAELDAEVALQDALGVVTAEGLRKRLDLQKAVRAEERAILIATLASNDAIFQAEFKKLQDDFAGGAIDEATLRARLAAARTAAEQRVVGTTPATADPRLRAFDAQTQRDTATGEKDIRVKQREEEINKLKTLAERERATALGELQDRLDAELILFAGNEDAKNEILAKAAKERAEIEEKFLRETNRFYQFALDVKTALEQAFTDVVDDETRKQAEKRKGELDSDLESLKRKAIAGELSLNDFQKQASKITEEQAKVQQTLAQDTFDFDRDIKRAGIVVAESFEKNRVAATQKASEELLASENDLFQLRLSLDGKSAEEQAKIQEDIKKKEDELNDKRIAGLENLAASASATFLTALAQGEDAGKAFGRLIFDTIQQAVPGIVALIFGQAIATLGPILGPIASGALTATFYGLIALARGQIQGNASGDIRIKGPGSRTSDSILRRVSVDESIVSARGTLAPGNEEALRWMNKGNSILKYPGLSNVALSRLAPMPLREDLARNPLMVIAPNGQLLERALRQSETAQQTAQGVLQAVAGLKQETQEQILEQGELLRRNTHDIKTILDHRLPKGGTPPPPPANPWRTRK